MDKEIADLKAKEAAEEVVLNGAASQYFVSPPRDFYLEVTSRPLTDVLSELNKKTPLIMTVTSYSHSGHIWSWLHSCPWPLHGDYGPWVDPELFAGTIVIAQIGGAWNTDGLDFRLSAAGAAGLLVAGGAELCGANLPFAPGAAGVVVAAIDARGRGEIATSSDGLEFKFVMVDPVGGVAYVVGLFEVPFAYRPKLGGGTVKNIVGEKGSIRITKTGELKCYSLAFLFNHAANLAGGPSASGDVTIQWLPIDPNTGECPK